jgi:Signal transduction histidine kinase
MSHELRTPLINIMGYSEILADEIDDPTHHEMLESIQKGGERLRDTLESILDLSNIESDKFDTLVTVHNLNKTAEKVFKEYREAAKSKGLGFILELCDQTPTALIDEKFIYQVIDNLVNNALKYTDSGFVRISTEIVGSGGRKSSVVTVQDTGIGIKPENMQVIFEPFRQGDEGLGRQYEGAGIGLTVARKYVEIMGGELTVESNPNHGSVFRVSFVYTSEDQLEIDYQDADDKKLILIVEDDQTAANLMRMYLMQNYRTIVVMHSEEAMAVLGEQKVDLVIVDINLPGSENGIELQG